MTPDEACRHEWLQPNSTSTTFIITSTSTSSLTKHGRDQVKENDHDYAPILQKLQRSQPITPLTILPQIKTPSNHASQNYNNNNNSTKDSNKVKGKCENKRCLEFHSSIQSSMFLIHSHHNNMRIGPAEVVPTTNRTKAVDTDQQQSLTTISQLEHVVIVVIERFIE